MIPNKFLNIFINIIVTFFFMISIEGCSTPNSSNKSSEENQFDEEAPLEDNIKLAIETTGITFVKVNKHIKKKNLYAKTNSYAKKYLLDHTEVLNEIRTKRAVHFYKIKNGKPDNRLIKYLIEHDHLEANKAGWQLASYYPSAGIKKFIEGIISIALVKNSESRLYYQEVAFAILSNKITNVFTFLRQGLLYTGIKAFAQAMAYLLPEKSSNKFMTYLSLATLEDLRQLNQKTIELNTAVFILNHFVKFPPDSDHKNIAHLFYYSVSRNSGLRELSFPILENLILDAKSKLADNLAKLPRWVQVSFVERNKDKSSKVVMLFLQELKTSTPHKEVIDEISRIQY